MATAGEERTPEPVLEREIKRAILTLPEGYDGVHCSNGVLLLLLWRIQLLEIAQSFQFSRCAAGENVLCSLWTSRLPSMVT